MSMAERVPVPLNSTCSRKWEQPCSVSSSSADPTPTHTPMLAERTPAICSVTMRSPEGSSVRRTTEVTEAEWEHDLALNLSGPFYCAQAAIPHLLEAPDGGGTIVNVASVAGLMGEAYSAAYTAAKHGVVGLTKALAVEHLKQPLRVNCVCPGGMDTPQVQTIGVPDDADWDLIMRVAATRGLMSADSVAAAICFLASNDAAAVNGSIHAVDAGRTAG